MPLTWNLDGKVETEPPPKLSYNLDLPEEEDKTKILWAGRPVTLDKIREVAESRRARGLPIDTPESIIELGTPLGQLESRVAQSFSGQTILEVIDSFTNVGQKIAAEGGRALGYNDFANKVYDDIRKRRHFLDHIEQGGDVETLLGERGGRIYNGTIQLATQVAALGKAGVASSGGGTAANYSFIAMDSWGHSLDEAQRNGFSGNESIGYAALHSFLATSLAMGVGKLAGRGGVQTSAESFSPAFANQTRRLLSSPESTSVLKKAVREFGGWAAEGAQFALMEGGAQAVDMAYGLRDGFDIDAVIDSAAMGVAMRGSRGAGAGLKKLHGKLSAQMKERARAVNAAETDIARGVNPLEVQGIVEAKHFARETGRAGESKQFRESYREAVDFYINEARRRGETAGLEKMETQLQRLHEERRQAVARARDRKAVQNKGKTGESVVKTEPVAEQPAKTANERAQFSAKEFEQKVQSKLPMPEAKVVPIRVNPLIRAPWQSETRVERSLRSRTRQLGEARQHLSDFRASVKAEKKLTKAQHDVARELIENNVPPAERDTFFKRQQAATTPARINKFLDALGKYVDDRDHRTAKRELYESFRKAANLRSEFGDQVKEIRRGIDFRKFKGEEAARNLKKLAEENPNIILSEQDKANLARLESTHVDKMTAADLRGLAEHVQDLAYQSALKDRLITHQESVAIQDVADRVAVEAAAAPPLAMVAERFKSRAAAKPGREAGTEQGRTRQWESLVLHEWSGRPEAILEADPTLRSRLYDEVMRGEHNFNFEYGKHSQNFANELRKVGLEQDTSIKATTDTALGDRTKHDRWRDQVRQFGEVEITRDQAALYLWELRDPQNKEALWGRRVKVTGPNKFLPPLDSKLLTELAEFVGPEGNHLIDFAFRYGNGPMIEAVNTTHEALKGRPLTRRRDVVPRHIRPEDTYVKFTSGDRSHNAFDTMLVDSYGHLKRREGGAYNLELKPGDGFIDSFMNHSRRMLQYANMAIPARNAEVLLNHPDAKEAIQKRFGIQGYDGIGDAIRMQVAGTPRVNSSEKAIRLYNSAVAGAHITGKLTVAGAQALDPLYAAAYDSGGLRHYAAGMNELSSRNPAEVMREMNSVLTRYSGEYWLRNLSDDVATVHTYGMYQRGGHFRVPTMSQQMIKKTVQFPEQVLAQLPNYLAAKAEARERFGLDPGDHKTYIDDPAWGQFIDQTWTRKTLRGSTSSHPLELSGALRFARKNPLAGLVMNFMNQTKNIASVMQVGSTAARQGQYGRAAAMFGTTISLGLLYSAWREALSFRRREDDETFAGATLIATVDNLITTVPVLGDLIDSAVVRPLTDRRVFNDNPILLLSVLSDGLIGATRTSRNIFNWSTGQINQQDTIGDLEDAAKLATLLGLPVPAVLDVTKRLYNGDILPGLSREDQSPKKRRRSTRLRTTL